MKLRGKEKDILKNHLELYFMKNDDPINKNEEKVNSKKKKNPLYLVFVEVNNNLLKDLSLRAVLGGAYKSGTESERRQRQSPRNLLIRSSLKMQRIFLTAP